LLANQISNYSVIYHKLAFKKKLKSVENIENFNQMKNIIVPLDFSTESLKGIEMGLIIAQKTPVRIQMVYVQKKTDIPSMAEEEFRYAEKNFKKLMEEHKGKIPQGSSLNYIIKKGKVYQEIVNQAEAFPDSLIVASTHGASGFEELFIGSNANKIISSTTRPVITIRHSTLPATITKIVLPIDFVVETRQKVIFTSFIAKIFGAEIHVVSVTNSKSKKITNRLNAYSAQVCNYLKTKEIEYKTASLFGNSIGMVIDYAEKINAEMISIINESGDSITDLIIGGEAQQMISKSHIPVLTIRAKPHFIKDSFSAFGG
jgi:nucleotide-binding universal stress UspA family protein